MDSLSKTVGRVFVQLKALVLPCTKSCWQLLLELFGQPGLLEYPISGMTGFDGAIYRKITVRNGAVPNFMVALSLSVEAAACLCQQLLEFAGVVGH
jgi:hypothetical protein